MDAEINMASENISTDEVYFRTQILSCLSSSDVRTKVNLPGPRGSTVLVMMSSIASPTKSDLENIKNLIQLQADPNLEVWLNTSN